MLENWTRAIRGNSFWKKKKETLVRIYCNISKENVWKTNQAIQRESVYGETYIMELYLYCNPLFPMLFVIHPKVLIGRCCDSKLCHFHFLRSFFLHMKSVIFCDKNEWVMSWIFLKGSNFISCSMNITFTNCRNQSRNLF